MRVTINIIQCERYVCAMRHPLPGVSSMRGRAACHALPPPTARERRIFPAGAGAAAVRQLARLEGLLLPPRAALRPPSPVRGSSAIAGLRPPAVRSHSLPCPQELLSDTPTPEASM